MHEKVLLRKLGEETLYSAKGHFKSCDLRRQLITVTIWCCSLLSIVGLVGINATADRWISAIVLLGTIGLLIWNEGEGKNYRARHKEAGEQYLAIHKQIRSCFFLGDCNKDIIQKLSQLVIDFDKSDKPDISGFARRWAKNSIEKKNSETDNWFNEN